MNLRGGKLRGTSYWSLPLSFEFSVAGQTKSSAKQKSTSERRLSTNPNEFRDLDSYDSLRMANTSFAVVSNMESVENPLKLLVSSIHPPTLFEDLILQL